MGPGWCVSVIDPSGAPEHGIRVVCECQGPQLCSRAGGRGADSAFDHSLLMLFAVGTAGVQLWVCSRACPTQEIPSSSFLSPSGLHPTHRGCGVCLSQTPCHPSHLLWVCQPPAAPHQPAVAGRLSSLAGHGQAPWWGIAPRPQAPEHTWPRCDSGRKSHELGTHTGHASSHPLAPLLYHSTAAGVSPTGNPPPPRIGKNRAGGSDGEAVPCLGRAAL